MEVEEGWENNNFNKLHKYVYCILELEIHCVEIFTMKLLYH